MMKQCLFCQIFKASAQLCTESDNEAIMLCSRIKIKYLSYNITCRPFKTNGLNWSPWRKYLHSLLYPLHHKNTYILSLYNTVILGNLELVAFPVTRTHHFACYIHVIMTSRNVLRVTFVRKSL